MKLLITAALLIGALHIPKIATAQTQQTPKTANVPAAGELDWLRAYVQPLASTSLNADDADLKPLSAMMRQATVAAIGEVTHGTSEIYQMKGRLIRYLVERDGYTVFAIEANMPEAYRLNQYITYGKGDPKELIKGMLFWTWDTQEMLDIVEWMRTYNEKNTKKILFTGIDMQGFEGPLGVIKTAYHKYNTDSSATLKSLQERLKYLQEARRNKVYSVGYRAAKNNKRKFRRELNGQKKWVNLQVNDKTERTWILQNIRLLEQYTEMVSPATRDQFMAENLLWIKQQYPTEKIILWAHNGHIQKHYRVHKVMGQYLADALKNEYYALGFAFHEGDYTAKGKNGLSAYDAQKSAPGSFEYYFHQSGLPIFLIDITKIPKENPDAQWMTQKLNLRWTGAATMDNEFSETELTSNFDALIYIDKTSHSHLLHPPAVKQ